MTATDEHGPITRSRARQMAAAGVQPYRTPKRSTPRPAPDAPERLRGAPRWYAEPDVARRALFPPDEQAKFWIVMLALTTLLAAACISIAKPCASIALPPALRFVSPDSLLSSLLMAFAVGLALSVDADK